MNTLVTVKQKQYPTVKLQGQQDTSRDCSHIAGNSLAPLLGLFVADCAAQTGFLITGE